MNNQALILLHEEALSFSHPVFSTAPDGTKAVFIWDDNYFKKRGYSLKKLVFIYETLCELGVDILKGEYLSVIDEIKPTTVYMPEFKAPEIKEIAGQITDIATLKIIAGKEFVSITDKQDFKRFFPYWNKAQKTAFGNDNA